jgi:hypothetical protein
MPLTANGTVTSLLEACTGEPITTRTYHPQPDEQLVTPLTQLLRGGRGGEVPPQLYFCLTLIATKPPHKIRERTPARTWAEMLALPVESQCLEITL